MNREFKRYAKALNIFASGEIIQSCVLIRQKAIPISPVLVRQSRHLASQVCRTVPDIGSLSPITINEAPSGSRGLPDTAIPISAMSVRICSLCCGVRRSIHRRMGVSRARCSSPAKTGRSRRRDKKTASIWPSLRLPGKPVSAHVRPASSSLWETQSAHRLPTRFHQNVMRSASAYRKLYYSPASLDY